MGTELHLDKAAEMLQLAQLERLRLRNELLSAKLASLGRPKSW
jgi:hypothetical protein